MMELEQADPKGLMREAYRIDGITLGECRSIFVDWALSLPLGADTAAAAKVVLAAYAVAGHPMGEVLAEALKPPAAQGRRGGRRGRVG